MNCVVCAGAVTQAEFANAWEAVRKLYPCCSTGCAERFDPDVHWIPATMPPQLDPDEHRRLLGVGRQRLWTGDRPSLVVRDLLIAGVGANGIAMLIGETKAAAKDAEAKLRKRSLLGAISGLLLGRWRFYERADKWDLDLLGDAEADLASWRSRFLPDPAELSITSR
jgi:hypothetical protein